MHEDDDSKKAVEKARREAIKDRPLHRNIKYPAFMNISRDEAIKRLQTVNIKLFINDMEMTDNPDIFVNYVIQEKKTKVSLKFKCY